MEPGDSLKGNQRKGWLLWGSLQLSHSLHLSHQQDRHVPERNLLKQRKKRDTCSDSDSVSLCLSQQQEKSLAKQTDPSIDRSIESAPGRGGGAGHGAAVPRGARTQPAARGGGAGLGRRGGGGGGERGEGGEEGEGGEGGEGVRG